MKQGARRWQNLSKRARRRRRPRRPATTAHAGLSWYGAIREFARMAREADRTARAMNVTVEDLRRLREDAQAFGKLGLHWHPDKDGHG